MLLTLPALLIDASNLNLRFNPDAAECLTWKDDSETLLGDLGAFGAKSGRTVSAIFDGGAYHGEYAGGVFEAPDAGVRILFTPKGASADDAMIELASSMCADDAAAAAFSAGDACDYLETERGLVQLTLKKSPAGRAKRSPCLVNGRCVMGYGVVTRLAQQEFRLSEWVPVLRRRTDGKWDRADWRRVLATELYSAADGEVEDLMARSETLELVRAYYTIKRLAVRKRVSDMVRSIATVLTGD